MKGKKKVEFSLDGLLNNPVTRKQLEGFVEEIVISKEKAARLNEACKDIIGEAKDALGVPGKVLMKLVREKLAPGSIDADLHDLEEVQKIAEGLGYTGD